MQPEIFVVTLRLEVDTRLAEPPEAWDWPDLMDMLPSEVTLVSATKQTEETVEYGVTWSNDEESVCQTGYVYGTVEQAKAAALKGLALGERLSTDGPRILGTQIDGMNNADSPQAVKYAIIQTENDDVETITAE